MKLTYQESLAHFEKAFSQSKEVSQLASEYIPGGYSRRSFNYGPYAVYVDSADGAYIYTIDGKKLLDFNNNFTVSILGYNNEQVDEAVQETMKKGYSLGNPTVEEYELAKMLCERVASVERVKFFCSASEAVVGALRVARSYTGKTKIAKMEGGYHGFTDDISFSAHPNIAMASDDLMGIIPQSESLGIPDKKAEDIVVLTQNNIEVSERLIRENADELACVILELQTASGGIVTLEKSYVERIREVTKELNILLIFDETITIRAAKGGLQGEYGIQPDLTVMGKTIGGGIPLGAIGGKDEIMQIVAHNDVALSGTHHGHRLACAAGIACLKQLDDAAYTRLNAMTERIKEELNEWAYTNNYPFLVFGEASVLGYVFTNEVGQKIETHRDYHHKTDSEKMMTYALEIAVRGYYPVHRGQLGLTLAMSDDDITGFIETTKAIITEMYEN